MSERPAPEANDGFEEKLAVLRLRIDSLPEPQRGHLCELADEIAQRHRKVQNRTVRKHDAV
ncbi:MAG: hypothetical protein ACYC3X_30215 [Pirellulaceae bacterium]